MVLHALEVLEALARAERPPGFAQLLEETKIPPATLNRLLARLGDTGYARKVARGTYAPGPRLLVLGLLATKDAAVDAYRATLDELAAETGLNAELYALAPGGVVFLAAAAGTTEFRLALRPGHRLKDVVANPAGRFFLHRFPAVLERCAELQLKHELTRKALEELVAEAARRRFAVDRGMVRPELARVGAPAPDGAHAVCLSGLLGDIPQAREPRLRKTLHAALKRATPLPALKEA
ncbi:MAG: helix-turn-helix domain-containing protein [Planctomycetota bacterium]|nr:helix-turn-helix domain-containing protein [Planctomycetota bacterium]